MTIRVLIVEDEAIAAQAHKTYVGRMPEFEVVAVAESFQEAARVLGSQPVDLVLLDMHLPDGHGLDLLRQLRATGRPYDVIAVTSARDVDVVRQSVSQGVVAYLLKPFTFAMFEAKLRQYAAFRRTLEAGESIDQRGVDAVFGAMRPAPDDERLPKGLSAETLEAVRTTLDEADDGLTAGEVAELIGSSRVTARRYLEHLADLGQSARATRYGGTGRPHVEYRAVRS
ncbi:response regulator [Aeromicrobium ginsengisoli]|uniref:Transcriptional regulatory protein n=1 Tax=Aeromicrobium ginsengisoli TaxID=363867 RepID=A0A5M4FJN4_9ACTN|nr:response regulator [Aeromicrobium ginsengisoli]KAA1400357.1 response regulator [Aeromicrobium ginsengisoli]